MGKFSSLNDSKLTWKIVRLHTDRPQHGPEPAGFPAGPILNISL